MSRETSAILRVALLNTMKARTVEEAVSSIRVMCTKDDIDAVLQEYSLHLEQEKTQNNLAKGVK
jgi:hypothetical protein